FASLGHIYDFTKTLEKEQPTEPSLATELAPNSTLLLQTYPNPFNPETTIKYTVPQSGRVRLNIYNIQGQVIRTLVDAERASGDYQIRWDGRDARGLAVGSGVYLLRIRVGEGTAVKKIMLLK
ncbi:T9SS type A sorting domain-containing protein, partial [candidate division KSB1 bacterium]|nr:T9SS type A sorting domain-containing protein [candidate division KSB1 bacterium]NIR72863.1 T9SS type A sorting domain-containing protein [candidate division KSB1 bacterium]NIS26065.1 T9SS type A sorting domain-containing protein [candidate division KSB1 bacterium]NIT72865.1 T9SS type A sorting domain-containing protein [candidate division KSB1 bacterium]NIU26711.1 T9SS type A sorting domain-containing protein [candidate division KSB1 bacterium]